MIKLIKLGLIVSVLVLLIISCKQLAFNTYIKKYSIQFGSGGGITGSTEAYIIDGKGNLYKNFDPPGDTIFVKILDRSKLKSIIDIIDSKTFRNCSQNETGNMTKFIGIYENGRLIKLLKWPLGNENIPGIVKQLDELLTESIFK